MTEEILRMLDNARETLAEHTKEESSTFLDAREKPKTAKKEPTTRYGRYRARLEKGLLDNFNSEDVLFFFYDLLKERHEGVSYFVSNMLREKKQIKIAIERYGAKRVLEMTEFLMASDQTLLKVGTFSPAILSTKWGNTINVLTEEWIEKMSKPFSSENKREWGKPQTEDYEVQIGEWGDE